MVIPSHSNTSVAPDVETAENGPVTVTLKVTGMMCQQNCAAAVARALAALPCARGAAASFADGTATVALELNYSAVRATPALLAAVEGAGYSAEVLGAASAAAAAAATVTAAAAPVPLMTACSAQKAAPLSTVITSSGGGGSSMKCARAGGGGGNLRGKGGGGGGGGALSTTRLAVTGMSCAACVSKVQQRLLGCGGVASARVALLLERAEVTHDTTVAAAADLARCLEAVGYGVEVLETRSELAQGGRALRLRVERLSCGACAAAVAAALSALEGVTDVSVDAAASAATLRLAQDGAGAARGGGADRRDRRQRSAQLSPVRVPTSIWTAPRPAGARDAVDAVLATGHPCAVSPTPGAPSAESTHRGQRQSRELREWARLLALCVGLSAPLMWLHVRMAAAGGGGGGGWGAARALGGASRCEALELALAAALQAAVGSRFYRSAFMGLKAGFIGMDFLIAAGTSAAFLFSLGVVAVKAFVDPAFARPCTFETAAMLLTFVTLGRVLEAAARGQTSAGITALLRMQPAQALLVEGHAAAAPAHAPMPHAPALRCPHTTHPLPPHATCGGDGRRAAAAAAGGGGGDVAGGGGGGGVAGWQRGRGVRVIDAALVQCGDVLRVAPGARVPADGDVLEGCSYVDESALTGEGMPVAKGPGDPLYGGSVNQLGALVMRATRVGADTALSQIAALVQAAQASKPPIQVFSDRVAGVFAPCVLALAAVTFIAWYGALKGALPERAAAWNVPAGSDPLAFALLAAVAVAVVACPCALGLATPTAVMVGTGVGAREGVLVKGGAAFERAARVTAVVFDKTGTLTRGAPALTDAVPLLPGFTGVDVVRIAATAEAYSEHPVAAAVTRAASARQLWLHAADAASFRSAPGQGIACRALAPDLGYPLPPQQQQQQPHCSSGGAAILVGLRRWMTANGVAVSSAADSVLWELEAQAKTAVLVALRGVVVGALAVADEPRVEARAAVADLQRAGLHVWLMTGDNARTAEAVARRVGIPPECVLAELLPAHKARRVQQLQRETRAVVAMVGDGVNDSPALAAADVGIAIGAGAQVAVEAADMVLVRADLLAVGTALDLSRAVLARIRLNFAWALGYNAAALPLAAGALLPPLGLSLTPPLAAAFMASSSTLVVLSSLALNLYRPPGHDPSCAADAAWCLRWRRCRGGGSCAVLRRGLAEMVPLVVRRRCGGGGGGGGAFGSGAFRGKFYGGKAKRDDDGDDAGAASGGEGRALLSAAAGGDSGRSGTGDSSRARVMCV